jgi:hypothetical protein
VTDPVPEAASDTPDYPMGPLPTTAEGQAEAAYVIETVVQARRARANKATRGVLAALLLLEAVIVLLVPRAIAQTDTGLDATKTGLLIGLAVLLAITAFLLRLPFGIGLGSLLQLAVIATGVLTWVMLFIGVIFAVIWVWVLTMRRDLAGTRGGWHMFVS